MKWWIGEDTGFFDEEDIRNSEYNIKHNWYYNNENIPDLYGKKSHDYRRNMVYHLPSLSGSTKFFYGRSKTFL